ncbi:MAG: twin-arginine translocase TatA/TatE family subunit [Chloroflexi bacterium]|nr:twin-arginine translocase TatA/TatE family subunit [Chloroflexota bacterium]
MPFNIGPMELIIVLVVILIVFGVGRLPEVGGALGKGIREFRRSSTGEDERPPAKEAEPKQDKSA